MKTYCYMRVSTSRQDHSSQREPLESYCARERFDQVEWIEETGSGAKRLPRRDALLELARRTPIRLVAWKLDRLGRSTLDVMTFCDAVHRTGSELVVVELGLDTASLVGQVLVPIFAAVAQLERGFNQQRSQAGVEHAKKHGTKSGRPFGRPCIVLSELDVAGALYRASRKIGLSPRARREGGRWRTSVIQAAARELGCSGRTLRRFLGRSEWQNPLPRSAPQDLGKTVGGGGE